jgi:hypothetical protein
MNALPWDKAVEIAKEASLNSALDYTCVENFQPHAWVVDAVQKAYAAGYEACYYDPNPDV